ncbi:MAG: tetratricopeptide repeat protein [Planctomycetes bacterium]|nr:tetratricopeptide repeat protein [Planctomycetota bacterium]
MSRLPWIAVVIAIGSASGATGQQVTLSTVPTQAVYEFQLNYQLPWQRWYGGPGLSLGGTMPTQGAFGYSTLNGIPLPVPLGAGVYVNSPAPNAINAPGLNLAGPMMPGVMPPGMMGSMSPYGQMGPNGSGMPSPGMGQPPSGTFSQTKRAHHKRSSASSPAARRASVEYQKAGDQKLQQQLWGQAYVQYRNSVDLAPERPEAHFRLGLSYAALKQFSSAVREFNRSVELDPTLPESGETLPTIFGADSKSVQSLILPPVADWTREDLRDPDRLFLLGLLLHFNNDARGNEILEAALRVGGPNDHILAFVGAPSDDRRPLRTPTESTEPAPTGDIDPLQLELPPSPLPLPDLAPSPPSPMPPPT